MSAKQDKFNIVYDACRKATVERIEYLRDHAVYGLCGEMIPVGHSKNHIIEFNEICFFYVYDLDVEYKNITSYIKNNYEKLKLRKLHTVGEWAHYVLNKDEIISLIENSK